MRSIKVDSKNDWMLDGNGNIATTSGDSAILQNTVTAMKAQRGEMPFDMTGGMPTLTTAWVDFDADAFEAAARRVIMGVQGVRNITSFAIERRGTTLVYTVAIQTANGNFTVSSELV